MHTATSPNRVTFIIATFLVAVMHLGSRLARVSGSEICLDQDLTLTGHTMMKVMTGRSDAIRMAICEAGNFPEFLQVVVENPRRLRRMLARYFERQIDARLIHSGHPDLLAQAFLGMFFSYTVLRGFLLDSLQPEITPEEVVEQFVTLFVRGTLTEQE